MVSDGTVGGVSINSERRPPRWGGQASLRKTRPSRTRKNDIAKERVVFQMPPTGVEPVRPAPEAGALSIERRGRYFSNFRKNKLPFVYLKLLDRKSLKILGALFL